MSPIESIDPIGYLGEDRVVGSELSVKSAVHCRWHSAIRQTLLKVIQSAERFSEEWKVDEGRIKTTWTSFLL